MNEYDESLLEESIQHGYAEMKKLSLERKEREKKERLEAEEQRKAAFIPPVPDGGWQPMETAPKDGTEIDIWVVLGSDGFRLTDISWDENLDGEGDWYDCEGEKALYLAAHEAVAWMKWRKP